MPHMLHASARNGHVALAVPDAVLDVVYRYRFTPEWFEAPYRR